MRAVLFTDSAVDTAVMSYRFKAPARETGINLSIISSEADLEQIKGSDVVFVDREFPRNFSIFSKVQKYCRQYSKPLILDMDDLLFVMDKTHPNRIDLSYANLLGPLFYAIRTADCLIVSTSKIYEACKGISPNVQLFENYLDDKLWQFKTPSVHGKGTVKILFMGTNSHQPDLQLIVNPLRNVLQAFPDQVEFVCFGMELPPQIKELHNARQKNGFIMDYEDFVKMISDQEFDIGIGPLQENAFNQSKSIIKYYEYSALGLASVMSNTAPYCNAINHGVDGMLARTSMEWENALTQLVQNKDYRIEMAKKAGTKVKKEALLSNNFHLWQKIINKVSETPVIKTSIDENHFLEIAFLEQETLNNHYKKALAQNLDEIKANQNKMCELTRELDQQNIHVHTLEDEVVGMNQKLTELASSFNALTAEHDTLNKLLEAKENEIEILKEKAYWLNVEVAAVTSSTSWGLLRPMRKVFKKLRRK